MSDQPGETVEPPADPPSLGVITRAFTTLGATSFGGGVLAYLRNEIVLRRHWLDDDTFLSGVELSQILPGLNATNMSVYIGERLRGAAGAFLACLCMILPGATLVTLLGIAWSSYHHLPDVSVVLAGAGAAAVGLTLATALQLGRKPLASPLGIALAFATFWMVGIWRLPLLVPLLTLGPLAIWLHRPRPAAQEPGS